MPLVILAVLGQMCIAYLLVQRVLMYRLYGPPPEELQEEVVEIAVSDEPERVYRELGEFLLNTADTSSAQSLRFCKIDIALGVSPRKAHNLLKVQNPRLRDAVIQILISKTVEEMDSPEDREFIKDEIRFAINEFLPEGEVLEVYFLDFLIQ